jgi:DNA-binding transcriptional LysR family regulator
MTTPRMIRYTLKQLSFFVSAAELESVTGAARALNVSQPAVSAAIAHLERVFGIQLFLRRHAQGLSLTPAGRRVFAEGRNLLSHARELASTPSTDGGPLRGELDLGCFLTFAPYYLPGLLRAFRERHPEVEIRLHEGDTDALLRGLSMGTLELAILYDLALGEVTRETLTELPIHAVLPLKHPLSRDAAVSLAALATEPFVLLDLPHSR